MAGALNKRLFSVAKKYIAGGVNSPVRSFKAVGGGTIFIKRAAGSKIYSEDGREFIDYCLSFGGLILGHANPRVREAVKVAIDKGTSFGAPTKLETELAKIITQAVPSIERLRLTNSGTEAVMGAVRLARAFTGRDKIIKFQNSYHGHADYFLNCPGIPGDFRKHTLVSPYNDIKKAEGLLNKYKEEIAAVIVEPVAANAGLVLPEDNFLGSLRELTQRRNILLIFDEVITGFRLTFGGAQKLWNIRPDLTCLGKIIGGGLPVGAFGGRYEIMRLLAPEGEVYQAGTFSGNPVTVSAGLTTLKILSKEAPYLELEKKTRLLCGSTQDIAQDNGVKLEANYIGSVFHLNFSQKTKFQDFYQAALKEGIYFAPSALEVSFLSTAHTDRDIGKTLVSIKKVFTKIKER